ncbi:hypothetical protein ACIGD1_24825 [Streptomyces sp. NPDC085612]|uniref:hypothetical protein n=1 Tax=Streptomyces sp. NPDC085612 TaxID=3365732 RepID=UPI0037CD97A0
MAAGAAVATATRLTGAVRYGRALLLGAPAAPLADHTPTGARPLVNPDKEQLVSERRLARVLVAAGVPFTLAGAAMYFLPGPGFPVLLAGLALLVTGLVMAAAARR